MHVKEIYVIFIHLFDSGILLIIDLNREKGGSGIRVPVAVSRNRYGVEKTVDTHKILINAIQFYVCLQEI